MQADTYAKLAHLRATFLHRGLPLIAMQNPATELKVFTSNATRALVDALAAEFERIERCRVSVTHDSAKVMLARIKQGERADAAVLLRHAIDELVTLGIITTASRRLFSRSRIGLGVLSGRPKPDISTMEAFKSTLLEAGSIAHTVHGASGMYFPKMVEALGMTEQLRDKIVTRPGGLIGRVVVAGEAEIAFQQVSEILSVPGLDLVGLIPPEVQTTFESGTGIFADAKQPTLADAFIRFFATPAADALFGAKGLESALNDL